MPERLMVFISYAHEDEVLRQALEKQLSALKRQGLIELWHDREISAGTEWEHEIDTHLKTAHIILLLVSPAFIASDYCYSVEMQRALERHRRGEARVIPVILRPASWQGTPLGRLQALPTDAKPITDPGWHDLDRAYLDIVEGIRKVVDELRTKLSTGSTRSRRIGILKSRERHHDGNITFENIEPSDLQIVPVMIQALDNQWIPRKLLKKVMQTGALTANIEKQLVKQVRVEYIRTLINGQQVVINLPYIYNNPAVYQDFLGEGRNREAFKALLETGVIVPFLSTEKSPAEHPIQTYYDMDYYGFGAWRQLCLEVQMQCLRLSQDDRENWELIRQQWLRRFFVFATSAAMGDIDTYLLHFRLDSDRKEAFKKRLVELGQVCLDFTQQDKMLSRSDLYKIFVTGGDNPAERRYDSTKPFAAEIKQLLDLAYNCYLADAIGGYLVTPVDSLPRTALQEWQQIMRTTMITGEELVKLVQRIGYEFTTQQKDLHIKSLSLLNLQDVQKIRRIDEWANYIQSLQSLLNNPLMFADGGAVSVYESYASLIKQVARLISGQYQKNIMLASWSPTIELVFFIAGTGILSCVWTDSGPIYQLFSQNSQLASSVSAPVVARLVIRDMSRKQVQIDLSIDFLRCRMPDPKTQWKEIERQVKKLPGYRELSMPVELADPILNYQEMEY